MQHQTSFTTEINIGRGEKTVSVIGTNTNINSNMPSRFSEIVADDETIKEPEGSQITLHRDEVGTTKS